MRKILLILTSQLLAGPAIADGELHRVLTQFDKDRLANFDKIQSEALAEGLRGAQEDVDILTKALAGEKLKLSDNYDPIGTWKCRVIKVGGTLPLTAYGWFKCRISNDGAGWYVEKISGSQRVTGRLYTKSETELIFVGAGHVNDDPSRKYGDDAQENQVAIVTRRGANKLIFEFPAPQYESKLDVMVLEQKK